jgi:hypothetical protein
MIEQSKVQRLRSMVDHAFRTISATPEGKIMFDYIFRTYEHDKITTGDSHTTSVRAAHIEMTNDFKRRIENGLEG